MQTIAFDVMGNERGTQEIIPAALKFLETNKNFRIILVGNKTEINKYLPTKHSSRLTFLYTKGVAQQTDGAFASRRADHSMAKALQLVKSAQADAIISAGASAVYLSLATLQLKRIKGLLRPAFMVVMPTTIAKQKFALLDVGANIEVKAQHLVQWAKLGTIFMQEIQNVARPRVGIINVGIEATKGLAYHQEAYQILQRQKALRFQGFIEPRNLMTGITDVAITDGYGGNMVLKTLEGTGLVIINSLKRALKRKAVRRVGAFLAQGAFKEMKAIFDYRNVGAAWVLGVNGIVLKAHGASDRKAFYGALNEVKTALKHNVLAKFQKVVIT